MARRFLYIRMPDFTSDRYRREFPCRQADRHEADRRKADGTDPAADRKCLEWLAAWCHRYSPAVTIDDAILPGTDNRAGEAGGGGAGLIVDITGRACLFRREGAADPATEEQRLGRDCLAALERFGFTARLAVAETPGAARAVACFSSALLTLVPDGCTEMALEPLPVAALGLPAPFTAVLGRAGLRRIADLARRKDRIQNFIPDLGSGLGPGPGSDLGEALENAFRALASGQPAIPQAPLQARPAVPGHPLRPYLRGQDSHTGAQASA